MSLDISERKRIAGFEDYSHCLNFYSTVSWRWTIIRAKMCILHRHVIFFATFIIEPVFLVSRFGVTS